MPRRTIKPRPVGRPGVPVRFEKLKIRNAAFEEFREKILQLPQLAYEVETLKDGRKIMITKPGGKSADDIMVWVYEGAEGVHWRPSHGQIYGDLEQKIMFDRQKGLAVLGALERVYRGEDPEDILTENPQLGENLPGLPVDLILKAYKWIWGQEDCNYPPPRFKGRKMSMDKLTDLKNLTVPFSLQKFTAEHSSLNNSRAST